MYKVGIINNKTLITFNNNYINTIITINPYSNFHFVTKDSFNAFCRFSQEKDEIIKFSFISYNSKLIYQNNEQIYVISMNEIYLNFLLFILNNPNNNNFYNIIIKKNMQGIMKQIGLDNMEKNEINDNNVKEIFNKSYKDIQLKKEQFFNLIFSLIKFDFQFQMLLATNEIKIKVFYLINKDWLENFKNKLNYIYWIQNNINNLEQIIQNMLNYYIKIITENDNIEIINPNIKILNYLKDNTDNKIIKFYDNYSFVNEDIWNNLIRFFNWNIEIKVIVYIFKKNILIHYDEYNLEIIEIEENKISWKLLFCLYKNYTNEQIIKEIQYLGIKKYFQKYNINIINNNQSTQKLFDNCNQCIGEIININVAKKNLYELSPLDNTQLNNRKLNLGLNINNNFDNIINDEHFNDSLNNRIDDYINKVRKIINPIKTDIIQATIKKDDLNTPNIINHIIQCLKNCEELSKCLLHPNSFNIFLKNQEKYRITSSIIKIMKIDFQNNNNAYYSAIKELINNLECNYYINVEYPERIFEFILDNIHQENKKDYNPNNEEISNYIDKREQLFTIFFDNIFKPENTTKISDLFFGVREELKNCGKCKKSNYEYYIFKYIEFQIEEILQITVQNCNEFLNCNRNESFLELLQNFDAKRMTLEKCFEFYLSYLKHQKSKYYCKKCSLQNDNYSYNNKIMILPNILCIVIKRYEGTQYEIDFPELLDISKYLENFVEKKNYELIAVISYILKDNKKNYFSLRKNIFNKKWFKYDENNTKECNISESKKLGFPYMIFYQKII